MTLSEQLQEALTTKKRRGCRTCEWLSQLSESEVALVESCIRSTNVTSLALWEVCSRWGLNVSVSQFRGHLKGCHEFK